MSSSEKSEANAKQIQRERFKLLRSNKAFIVGSFILVFWVFCAIFGQTIARYPINQMDFDATYSPPSAKYWFGTDQLGQDIFSRVIVGARLIVVISFLATALGTAIGASIGLAAGYFKGIFDMIVMRILEAISAIPVIIIALLAVASVGRSSPVITVLIIGFIFAPNIARTVRAAVLGEAELEYVAAARLRTERTPHILFREVLPNVLPPLIVEFTVRLGYAIFAVATLSFLGAGVETGSPDWGTQVAETWALIFSNTWWPTLFPALAIASLAVSINLISDALLEVFEI
jgi:peptide/nickel transport system permease protein